MKIKNHTKNYNLSFLINKNSQFKIIDTFDFLVYISLH